ncbi:hypothetical protein [Halobellus ordinarius]|uniref:hypothetical protein n=1 Tax=Halobellus ordinarius TaxID=3075120 RepID=UPI002880ACD5|nr:hypothetical protein [Halobellus sp. ZY16]
MSQAVTEIDLDDEADRWRYTCPRGHRDWTPSNYHFICSACARSHDDVDPAFEDLRDKKTGRMLAREEVKLTTDVGDYVDLYKGGERP